MAFPKFIYINKANKYWRIERSKMNAILFVSLGSGQWNKRVFSKLNKLIDKKSNLTCFLLDYAEDVNQKILNGCNDLQAQFNVEELVARNSISLINNGFKDIRLSSDLSDKKHFLFYYQKLKDLYRLKKKFYKDCNMQVYKNLHPKLKKVGIKNQRDILIESLSEYLIYELALKVYIFNNFNYDTEYMVHERMDVWECLSLGEYVSDAIVSSPQQKYIGIENKANSLELRDISFSYSGSRSNDLGLNSVSILTEGITSILGPSGSFKSTLLKLIAGHLKPTQGEIKLNAKNITHISSYERNVVSVFQDFALFPKMTAYENILQGVKRRGRSTSLDNNYVNILLRKFAILHCANRTADSLSGGEQQRVALARAIASEPEILLLDEPTAAIDDEQRSAMIDMLLKIKADFFWINIVVVTHDRDLAMLISDNIALIDRGQLIQFGKAKELMLAPNSRRSAELLGGFQIIKDGIITEDGFEFAFEYNNYSIHIPQNNIDFALGSSCCAIIPHECIHLDFLCENENSTNSFIMYIKKIWYTTRYKRISMSDNNGLEFDMIVTLRLDLQEGSKVCISIDSKSLILVKD